MKAVITTMVLLLGAVVSSPIEPKEDLGLPALHKIKRAILSPSFSCRSNLQEYQASVLFLSRYTRRRNSPDLLFNGACGSQDYFEGPHAKDDISLVADLGHIRLEDVSAHLAFNTKNIHSFDLYSKFVAEARVQDGHTYALLISTRDLRGLVVFTVVNYVPNQEVDLRYAVEEYQLLNCWAESEGFNWLTRNQPDSEPEPLVHREPQ